MHSLFEDQCKHKDNLLNGRVCEVLKELAHRHDDTEVLLVVKGTNAPLSLGGLTTPTVFKVKSNVPGTSTIILTYKELTSQGEVHRHYITGCHSLSGIVLLKND